MIYYSRLFCFKLPEIRFEGVIIVKYGCAWPPAIQQLTYKRASPYDAEPTSPRYAYTRYVCVYAEENGEG